MAVAMTVALPDICVSLEQADGRTSGARYKAWCQSNLPKEEFSFVTPDDLYSMRCGVLHNGRFGDLKHNVGRLVFALPGSSATFVNCQIGDAYVYSVEDFCKNFTSAVYNWFEAKRDDPIVTEHLPRLMQYRADGFPPYIKGATVLA